jgi:hypothetical protein
VIEQDIKFGHTEIPPKVSVAASLGYLEAVMNQLSSAAKA